MSDYADLCNGFKSQIALALAEATSLQDKARSAMFNLILNNFDEFTNEDVPATPAQWQPIYDDLDKVAVLRARATTIEAVARQSGLCRSSFP